jgi:two-component system response regulator MprA
MRVLVVEDSRRLAGIVKRGLLEEGYTVDNAYDGEEAEYMAETTPFDLIVLDIMLPKKDGLAVCRDLRAKAVNTPILMLTAKDTVEDKVAGLDTGADDYLVKPFAFDELLARLRALLRRARPLDGEQLHFADLSLDTLTRDARRAGQALDLTTKEYELLEFLLRHPRQVLSRDTIFERVWGSDFLGGSNVIDVHIMRLREKLEAGGQPRLIQTVRGAGYSLREEQA